MINFRDKKLLAARALAAKDWSAPSVIGAIRRAAHNGATVYEIHAEFWPDITLSHVWIRLKKFNIRPTPQQKRSRRGDLTSLPPAQQTGLIKNYRPRVIGEATSL